MQRVLGEVFVTLTPRSRKYINLPFDFDPKVKISNGL